MPLYLYEILDDEGRITGRFEVMQRLADPALGTHPETGQPVRRAIVAPALTLRHASVHSRDLMSDKHLANKGFTRYEKGSDGQYVRTGGADGPKTYSR